MARKVSKDKKKKGQRPQAKASPKDKKPTRERGSWRFHEGFGILTLAAALLLGPSLLSVQAGDGKLMGPFGMAVGSALNWLMGLCGYLLVAALVVIALRIFAGGLGLSGDSGEVRHSLWRERLGLMVGLLFCSILLHLVVRPGRLGGASAGGLVGELGAELLCSLLSTPGTWVICLAGLAISAVLATNLSWAMVGLSLAKWLPRLLSALGLSLQRFSQQLRLNAQAMYEAARRAPVEAELDADGAAALPPVIRLDLEHCRILPKNASSAAGQLTVPMPDDLEIERPPAEVPAINIVTGDPAEGSKDAGDQPPPAAGARKRKRTRSKKTPPPLPPSRAKEIPAAELTIVESRFQKKEEDSQQEEAQQQAQKVEPTDGPGFVLYKDTYQPPPMSLLEFEDTSDNMVDREAIYAQADLLVKTLADFKITGRITEVHPGPVITMYEYVPAPGTRINTVARLADDLAMSLSAQRVRIVAPIPGKGAIGIEVPNESREKVYFKEIVAHKTFHKSKSTLTLAMGKNIFGAPVAMDLAKMPHLLVAGATGAGKSVSINTMICSLLMKNTPEQVRMIMVDPKFLELSGYNDIPHLLLPVVTDPKKANVALRWAVNEMERRYQMLADMRVRDILTYNKKVDKLRGAAEKEAVDKPGDPNATTTLQEAAPSKVLVVKRNADGTEAPVAGAEPVAEPTDDSADGADPGAKTTGDSTLKSAPKSAPAKEGPLPRRLPHIVVIIDEFADLMMVASKEVETSVARLAQKARAAGIHLVLATQRPSVDVITGLIKANFPSRVSFRVAASQDSKTILGCHGAENLLGAGDMLVLDRGDEMKRLHGAYISDGEIQGIVDWLKEQGRPIYDMDILKPREDEESAPEPPEDHDVMYDQAVALVAETRQASISMIQRRLRVGYNRAARMVERMEREGVVGPPDGVRGREVLIQNHC